LSQCDLISFFKKDNAEGLQMTYRLGRCVKKLRRKYLFENLCLFSPDQGPAARAVERRGSAAPYIMPSLTRID
jgi:hypothetical protein